MATGINLQANSRVYNMKPHLTDNPNYLHYWAFHDFDNINAAYGLTQTSETVLLGRAKAKITNAWKKKIATLAAGSSDIDLEELNEIEKLLLDPSWLQNFSMLNSLGAPNIQMPSVQQTINNSNTMKQEAIRCLNSIQGQLQIIEQDILKDLGATPADLNAYMKMVEEYFTSGVNAINSAGKIYNTKAKGESFLSSSSDWQSKVLESILSRNNEGFYSSKGKYKGIFSKWSSDKSKLLATIQILKDPDWLTYINAMSENKVPIRHGNSKTGDIPNNILAVLEALFEKISKYFQQAHAIAAEVAAAQGIDNCLEELQKVLKTFAIGATTDSLSKGTNIGGRTFEVQKTTNFKGNEELFKLVETKENDKVTAWQRAGSRGAKSDANIVISKYGVGVNIGISVKDYNSVSINPNLNKATIDLQKNTPLLTLLTREANLSSKQMHSIYQLLAAHVSDSESGNEESDFALVAIWNDLIDKAKYMALLDTLAGFTNEEDQAMYFVFNHNIYTMTDILSYLQRLDDYKSAISWSSIGDEGAGLQYSTYNSRARWIGTKWRTNYADAETRSDEAMKSFSQIMYDTKIRVKLHIADLAAFSAIALN